MYFFFLSIVITPTQNPSETLGLIRNFLNQNQAITYLIYDWVLPWTIGLGFAGPLTRWFYKLWPNIEFDFGPKHYNIAKVRRNKIIGFLTIVILPIAISIVYDFLKGVF